MKKKIISIAFATLLISGSQTLSTSVQAETMDSISIEKLEDGSIVGGWIEGEPSVEEESIESIESSITKLARSSSPRHYGGSELNFAGKKGPGQEPTGINITIVGLKW